MAQRRRSIPTILLLVVTTALALSVVPTTSAGTWQRPRLRLIAAEPRVTLTRYSDRVYLNLGVFVAATRAPFELHVERSTYAEPVRAFEIVRSVDGDVRELPIPRELLEGWRGLAGFIRLVLTDAAGDRVLARTLPMCPNAYFLQRVDDSGSVLPTFPSTCGRNPFTRGMPWGIDQGWAAAVTETGPSPALDDGLYTARVSIREPFRTVLRIAEEDATVAFEVKVETAGRNRQGDDEEAALAADGSLTPAERLAVPDPGTVPDLRVLPAYGIGTDRQQQRDWLSFAADVWNAGPAPLVVEGFRREDEPLMDAYQYFFDDAGTVVGRARVGGFEYDTRDGHNHWHFRQFARYRLLDATKTRVVVSEKEAFCLVPTDPIDLLVAGAAWRPDLEALGSACGGPSSIWIRETLPAGWGDTYHQGLPGQSFDITALPNGTYFIEVRANPGHRLYERRDDNDVSYRKVILGGSPGARTVEVPAFRGIDTG